MKFEHIVCPVDFSSTSLNALRFAASLAKQFGSSLHLVHVYERPYTGQSQAGATVDTTGGGLVVDREEDKELRKKIDEQFHKLAELDFLQGLNVFKRLVADLPAWRFYEDINLKKADIIVMGTRGATGILHGGLIGTNTERVIRYAPTPVISVPEQFDHSPIKKILFATDFSDAMEELFAKAVSVANNLGAELIVGMINTRENFQTSKYAMDEFLYYQHKYPTAKMSLVVHNYLTVEEGIWDLCQTYDINMIAMHTHGRTGVAHLIRGSIAEDIASNPNIKIPLLTFKAAKKE